MTHDILEEARKYLLESLQGRTNQNKTRHPWRNDWEFAVLHSLRVEACVIKILAREQQLLTPHEIKLLQLAAILHDIARLGRRDQHAQNGAGIAKTWLAAQTFEVLDGADIEYVTQMIAGHSNKAIPGPDFCQAVLKDADALDEIGVMSIFMTSNWLETRSPFFFHNLRQRVVEFELPFCDKVRAALNTTGAKLILDEKKMFIENFVAQLGDELQADRQLEQILRG